MPTPGRTLTCGQGFWRPVIFTGTPSGIGWARDPKVLLQPGDELVTTIEAIGSMRNHFRAPQRTP
jgi:2-keto-4-pentenoate hydratase/2-oxohepta-3-ene-1,7-dioic acid hydratase in catechol pathway